MRKQPLLCQIKADRAHSLRWILMPPPPTLSCVGGDGEEVGLRREDWDTEEGHVYIWHR